jgi:hypothetical protein
VLTTVAGFTAGEKQKLPNSKFFHSLSITSIFGRMYGALNVDKINK